MSTANCRGRMGLRSGTFRYSLLRPGLFCCRPATSALSALSFAANVAGVLLCQLFHGIPPGGLFIKRFLAQCLFHPGSPPFLYRYHKAYHKRGRDAGDKREGWQANKLASLQAGKLTSLQAGKPASWTCCSHLTNCSSRRPAASRSISQVTAPSTGCTSPAGYCFGLPSSTTSCTTPALARPEARKRIWAA